jgi:hypothetical protein
MISKLEDEIVSRHQDLREMLKDDAALHRELAREKKAGESTEHTDVLDNRSPFLPLRVGPPLIPRADHCLMYKAGNVLQELRDAKAKLTEETDVEVSLTKIRSLSMTDRAQFDQFADSQIEREMEEDELLPSGADADGSLRTQVVESFIKPAV